VANAYDVGQLVRGTVTQLANFGAFARIEDGIEGLIHVSELTDERIAHPKQVVEEGQDLILRIIRIDPERRRMGLSLRRALDTPDDELIAALGEGVLEERDRIANEIAAAIEREGLEAGAEDEESEDEESEPESTVEASAETEENAEAEESEASDEPAASEESEASDEGTETETEVPADDVDDSESPAAEEAAADEEDDSTSEDTSDGASEDEAVSEAEEVPAS
jgi:predicted RNA-binding protein with RPS1 domain